MSFDKHYEKLFQETERLNPFRAGQCLSTC